MVWSLEDRAAICLAASQGLGLGIATEMVRAGARTLLVSRSEEKLAAAAREIGRVLSDEGPYPGVSVWHPPELEPCDLRTGKSAALVTEEALRRFGRIDILVNNIGGPRPGRFEQLSAEDWLDGYNQLVRAYVDQFQATLPWLKKSGAGRVLTVTSISSRQPIPGLVLSNTFRAGLVGLTKTLAQEYAADGILINNLAPGMFDTDRLRELDEVDARDRGLSIEVIRAERLRQIPLGRYGDPRELGRVAVFLASPANTMITGQTLLVDGGLYKGL